MQKFNPTELAAFAGNYARHIAGQPESFYTLMKNPLETIARKLNRHVLTDEELRTYSINLAQQCLKYFNSIPDEGILKHISPEVKRLAIERGLDLIAEEKYFTRLTIEMARAAMNIFWFHLSKKLSKR